MITRLNWSIRDALWRFALWVYGPWAICYNCKDYTPELHLDEIEHWCELKGDEIDPNGTCRAFRGWRVDA